MSHPDLQQVKQALLDAGIEVYQTRNDEIHVAERVRLHIMDSGVRVRVGDSITVAFTARSQLSDSPRAASDELFDRVRSATGAEAESQGFAETHADTVQVTDPVDADKILDVWYEITYEKSVTATDEAVRETRWALGVEKYVSP